MRHLEFKIEFKVVNVYHSRFISLRTGYSKLTWFQPIIKLYEF